MGITPKYSANNPPPFHLNVNNPVSYDYPLYNNGYNNNYSTFPQKINNTQNSKNNIKTEKKKKNEDVNNKYKKEPILENKEAEILEEKFKKDDFSIDINILTKDIVEVKIPIQGRKNKIWKKEYNKKELIGTVINDYLVENKLNLPDDFFSQLKCSNKPVSFQNEISSLLPEEIQTKKEEIKYPELIGKPFYDPFQILCFDKNAKKFITLNYNKNIKDQVNIEDTNITSAYCNGNNHLYISGGENCLNNFWSINLKKNRIKNLLKDMPPKKYHSMIYIPKSTVFIAGGNSLSTFYYNIKEKKLVKWAKLNIIRMEPALQVINNKLYCFNCKNIKEKDDYSYEVTDLYSKPKWEFIKPKINFNLFFNQQLFGVVKDKNNNIIFVGGLFINENNNVINNGKMNFMLDIKKNEIILSQVKYKKFNLKERGFFPFNKKYDCILTDFPLSSPQICFFNKKKSKLELINFSSDINQNNISNLTPAFSFGKNNLNENKTNIGLRNPNLNNKYNTYLNPLEKNKTNFLGKTPDKNYYGMKKLNYPGTEIYNNERNHSYDSRKFYHPKKGLNASKNIYNYYQNKNY